MVLPTDNNTQLVRGAFQFDVGALKQARAVVVQETRVITNEFKKIGGSAQQAEKEVRSSSSGIGGHLRALANQLDDISRKWAAASAAAAAFVVQGLRSADSINNLRIRFTGMLGSQEKAEKLMGEIGDRARELGQPMRAAQEAAAALLPQLNNNVESLKTYMGLASRLSALNQNEGLAGASFAIREAISSGGTDLVSLAERFNISKKQLREEIAAAKKAGADETTAFATALDKVLNKMGLTEDVAEELAGSLSNQVRVAMEEVNLAAGEMFAPLLKDLVPLVRGFSTWLSQLRETNPELLKIAAAGTLIVAAISPISFAVSKIITGFATLKTVALAAFAAIKANSTLLNANAVSWKNAGLATKVGVTGAALAGGVVLGGEVTRGLANAGVQGGDFERIRQGEDPLAIAGERFKQVIVILAAGLVEVGRVIAKAGAFIFNAFDQVVNALKLGASFIKEGFLRITEAFGNAVASIGNLLAQIPGQENNPLRDGGAGIARDANQQLTDLLLKERPELIKRLQEGFALPDEVEAGIDQTFDSLGASVVNGLNNFFFPPAQEAIEDGFQQAGEAFESAAEDMFSDDMVEAWGDFQDELAKIEADAEKERIAENKKYEADKTKLEVEQQEKRQAAIDEFNRKQTERSIKLGWDILDIHADFEKREIEEAKKYRREERKARHEHYLTLLKAAAALDGRAIYLEQQRYKNEQKEREADAKHGKNQRERERDERLAELQLQFDRESQLQNNNFWNVEYPQLIAQQAAEFQQFESAHQERLTQITTHAREQSEAAEQAFIDTFNKLVEQEGLHQDMMLGAQRKGQAEMEAELVAWWNRQKAMVAGTGTSTTYRPGYQNNDIYDPAPNQSDGLPKLPPPPPGGVGGPGGQTPVGNLSLPTGRDAARLAAMAVRGGNAGAGVMVGGLTATGAGKRGDTIIQSLTVPISFNGDIIRSKSDEKLFEDKVRNVLVKTLREVGS